MFQLPENILTHELWLIWRLRPNKLDGTVSLWNVVFYADRPNAPIAEPTVALAAIAMKTQQIRIGALLTPLARRRPWTVAREAVSLDHLSHRFPWEAFSALKLASILLPISAILSSFQAMTALEYLPIRVIRGKSVCQMDA